MSNSSSAHGFLMVELLVVIFLVSLLSLIIAHYQVLVIQWNQEVYDRLEIINYVHNFFPKAITEDKLPALYLSNNRHAFVSCQTITVPSAHTIANLKNTQDFNLLELSISWTTQAGQLTNYTVIGGIHS